MILSESEKRFSDPETGDTPDPIIWRGSVVGLVRFLERLCQDDLIKVFQPSLPSLIEQHFGDKLRRPILASESLHHLETPLTGPTGFDEDLIPWKGTLRLLPFLLYLLDQEDLLRLPRDKQKRSLYADVIIAHFRRCDGKPFNKKVLQNSLQRALDSDKGAKIAKDLVNAAKKHPQQL